MAKTLILPAALRYQGELAAAAAGVKAAGYELDSAVLGKVNTLAKELEKGITTLEKSLEAHPGSLEAEAEHACYTILPAMAAVRSDADELEGVIAADLWPLPSYQEMLFIK
jgi:glutamine synthetase